MKYSKLALSVVFGLMTSSLAVAQNFNSTSSSASVSGSNTFLMIGVGVVTLVAGGVIGYAVGRRK